MELMEYPQIRTIAIIAEGVPERVSEVFVHLGFILLKLCLASS